jgi:SpoVK/Ycf46/Vps4 family AAA+-type ATPase
VEWAEEWTSKKSCQHFAERHETPGASPGFFVVASKTELTLLVKWKGGFVLARSDILLSIVRAGATGDKLALRTSVEAAVAEERQKNHHVFADRLQRVLGSIAVSPPAIGRAQNNSAGKDAILEVTPRVSLDDLILPLPAIVGIKQVVEEQHRGDLLRAHGLQPRNRILLSGPPGNGKTSVAEALAEALALPLFIVRYDALIGSFLGETNIRLAKLFDYVRTTPCVFFFDEFDAIGKERGDQHETGEIKRVVSFLLMQIDQLPSYVVTVAATNHAELLDGAVWRRFQLRLNLPSPTKALLAELLDRHLKQWPESVKHTAQQVATAIYPTSFAEALEFVQTVRRQHILSMASRSLDSILTEQLLLWKERLIPGGSNGLRSDKTAVKIGRAKKRPKTKGRGRGD